MWQFLDMVRIRTLLSSVMAFALLSSSALAADVDKTTPSLQAVPVNVRSSDKGDYSRIVFDWSVAPKYTAHQTETELIITFDRGANFLISGVAPNQVPRIKGYKVISSNTVGIDVDANESIRHFVVDNRLIIDVKDKEGNIKPKKEESLSEKKSEPTKPIIESEKAVDPINLVKDIKEGVADKAVPKDVVVEEEKKDSLKQSPAQQIPTISITSIESIALAVFERSGYLWVVQDKDGIKIPPQLTGMPAEVSFERVSVPTVSAFRLKLPDSLSAPIATGGGLVWKLAFNSELKDSKKAIGLKYLGEDGAEQKETSILWPVPSIKRIVEFTDPDVGDKISVTCVESAAQFVGGIKSYVDFNVLPSFVGLAVTPKSDDLKITKTADGVLFSKPNGLDISRDEDILASVPKSAPEPVKAQDKEISRIFDFLEWQIGTKNELSANQRLIMAAMADQTDGKKTENLVGLARLALSFNYAPEAMGYLELAQSRVPELDTNPEFIALRGLANALSWRDKEAFADFSVAGLSDIDEIKYWKAYALAKLDDWQQAAKIFPDDVSIISTYPEDIRNPFALVLAEIALREGNAQKAKKILDMMSPYRADMEVQYASAFDYLQGEYARQTGKPEEAKKLWTDLTEGVDDLYRAKSRFALTMLQLGSKEITADKAIDNLEGLRYAWRGDDLEVSINYNLAKAYLEKGEPIKALTMMKMAYALNPASERGKKIDSDMRDIFKNLFTGAEIKKLSPADALVVYNEFSGLAPTGSEGEALARQLAERLVDADLLPRAIVMLRKQLDDGIKGEEGAAVAIRLAALQNMDGKADEALQSLDKADLLLKDLPVADVLAKQRDIGMLRAKAYSLKNKLDDAFGALALLPQDNDTLRFRADIAWKGKRWQDAADSLEQLVQKQEISLTRPLTDEQADLLLNWAVALYLADNRYVLANVRERYADAMAATNKAKKFDVVTRPRQAALLADRETINSIVDETVIFKDFLKSFNTVDVPSAPSLASPPSAEQASPVKEIPSDSAPIANSTPAGLRNIPGLKTDEVLGD